jgi:serine/threonine protein kinase
MYNERFEVGSESVRIEPGTAVGPYVVERRLGGRAAGITCVARSGDGGRVVLKVLPGEGSNQVARARFLRDVRTLAAVEQRNVVRVDASGEHDGMAWIAMEYVPGTDLARLISERGVLRVDVALRYAIQIAEGLVAAHDVGLVHGALRPSKVLLAPDGRVVLVDFGIPGQEDSAAYLSPEQVEHGIVDGRSDVWALGCVLYEMSVGEPPFGRGGQSTLLGIVHDEPTFPPDVTGAIVHIVSACLRKSSFARVGSPRELANLMRDALESPDSALPVGVDHRASSSQRRSARPSAPPPPSASQVPSAPRISTVPSRPPSIPPSWAPNGMRVPPLRGRIKGTAVRAGLTWFVDAYGGLAAVRVGEIASPEIHATFRFGESALGVMPSSWYDTQIVGELLIAMESAASPAEPDVFVSRLAEAIARDNVNGVYRALFRLVASPSLLEANAQRVWRTYVDEGTLTVRARAPGSFEARVRGWSRHHAAVCRMLRPLLEHLLREVGYTALVVERTECVADGSSQCTFEGTWLA